MILKNGITGFHDCNSDKGNRLDEQVFKAFCYDLAFASHGKVCSVDVSLQDKNFYVAHILSCNASYYILLNKSYPYLAFASNIGIGNISFIEKPCDIDLSVYPYELLGMAALNTAYNETVINT